MCSDLFESLWGEHPWIWRDAFAILSLDGVRPFFEDMAIALRDPQAFQDALRATIRSYREAYTLTGQPYAPDPKTPLTRAMVEHGLDTIAQALDQHERTKMKYWLLNIYSPGPSLHPSATSYRYILGDWVREYHHRRNDIVGFAAPDEIEARLTESRFSIEIDEQLDQARVRALSSWDEFVYELAGYSNDPSRIESMEAKDPFDLVKSTIFMERFRKFWSWLLEEATAEQMLTLRRLAMENTKPDEEKWGALPLLCDPNELFP